MSDSNTNNPYDAIIIGGAISGSATALLAKKMHPELRILIIDRSEKFGRRVGESTVEVSSYFLGEVLGLSEYLGSQHLNKQGLRFYFHNEEGKCPDSCSEIGPLYNVRLASFQVDRAELDQYLLNQCRDAGIEILRPAEVKKFELNPGGLQSVLVRANGSENNFQARWLVDASGTVKLLARKSGWVNRNEDHPIHSAWARWSGVVNWDNKELKDQFPDFGKRCYAKRNTATNHLIGKGWWSWWIPLKDGDVSIGIVWDDRLVEPPEGDSPGDRLRGLLETHPMAKSFLKDASINKGDVHWRRNLPYWSEQMVGDGFALVGDAAAFIDPFYSPGLDWVSYTSYGTAHMIAMDKKGKWSTEDSKARNDLLVGSYHRWFKAIYKDKYYYMGDWELMKLAFRLDVGLYYFGVASQSYKYGDDSFLGAPLNGPQTDFPAWLIATYTRRLATIGKMRMKRGTWGKKNNAEYFPFRSFTFDLSLPMRNLAALGSWLLLEVKEGWRSWFTTP